jgi:hypothetical protein
LGIYPLGIILLVICFSEQIEAFYFSPKEAGDWIIKVSLGDFKGIEPDPRYANEKRRKELGKRINYKWVAH